MYINSKHLQIFYFIQRNPNLNLKDISDIFNFSPQRIKILIEDIYSEFFENNSEKKSKIEMLEALKQFKGGKSILKKSQFFTKEQNIFYILFFLGTTEQFKIRDISSKINITPRNLNNYSIQIKKILEFCNLDTLSSNNGIKLIGSKYDIDRFKFYLYFKFLIEKDYLPKQMREDFMPFFKVDNFNLLRKKIKEIADDNDSENSILFEKKLLAYYLAFHPGESFDNLSKHNLKDLFYIKNQKSNLMEIENIFEKNLPKTTNASFSNILQLTLSYSELKEVLFIDDPTFLDLNLSFVSNSNFLSLTKEIQDIYPRFSIFESFVLWYVYNENDYILQNNIFVYKNLNPYTVPSLVKELEKKHNIKIFESISYSKVNSYLKEKTVDTIFLIENINMKIENTDVKLLSIPFQNYKKL